MSLLDRKLLRDLRRMRGQVLSIALVVACGVATNLAALGTWAAFDRSRARYYADTRFADLWAHVHRAPDVVADEVRAIPGVTRVEARIVRDVPLDIDGLEETAMGHLVSVPDGGQPSLNRLYLRVGRMPSPDRPGEAVVSENFAAAHHLAPGSTLPAVLNGRRQVLRIVGVGMSPEYVFVIRPGALMPEDRTYAVFWVNRRTLESAWQMEGLFDDLTLSLAPGTSRARVIDRVDRVLARWGGAGAYGRDRQPSHRLVDGEIQQLAGMARTIPTIFLGVAAFLLNVVLGRVIRTQREQIAALKALGFGPWTLGAHYLKFSLLVSGVGALLGVGLGRFLGGQMMAMYQPYLRFPVLRFELDPRLVVLAVGVSLVASVVGVWRSLSAVMKLPAAEAMRPEAPANYNAQWLDRLGLQRLLTVTGRMLLRDLLRTPLRLLLSSLAVGLAASILVVSHFSLDAIEYLLALQFGLAQREDLTVGFFKPLPMHAVYDLRAVPGVLSAEGLRDAAVRLSSGARERTAAIQGVPPQGRLRRVFDMDARRLDLPERGLVLSSTLASRVGVRPGDLVSLRFVEGAQLRRTARVAAVIDDVTGMSAYMRRASLWSLMGEGPCATGAALRVDPARADDVLRRLRRMPQVASATRSDRMIRAFRQQNTELMAGFTAVLVAFAGVIAVGVVYNNARIALATRSREYATMRVLGFTRGEVAGMLAGEQAVQIALGIPVGLALGRQMAAGVAASMDPELIVLPLVIAPSTYGFAALVVVVAGALSVALVRRQVDRLDMVAVLKARD
ncbi:MAG: FtsX-like permease family protein [Polyangiales bacterium]